MKFKSITTQMTLMFGALMLIICAGLGICAFFSSSNALKSSIDENLMELAKANAKTMSEKIKIQFNSLGAWANDPSIKSSELSVEEKLEFLDVEVIRSG